MDDDKGTRSHGSVTSKWKLQGLDMFQRSVFWDFGRMGYKIFVSYNTPAGGPWVGLCEQKHLNINMQ